jgi:hypothetical protein
MDREDRAQSSPPSSQPGRYPAPPPSVQMDPPSVAHSAPLQPDHAVTPGGRGPVPVKVTNAFSVGFFGFLGAFVASIVFWILALVLFGTCMAGALRNATVNP